MNHLLPWLSVHIIAIISALGYGGILVLMAVESACVPLPSEIILPFAGYLASTGRFQLLPVAIVGALGCNLGSWVAYEVGAWGGRPLAERYGRWLLVSPGDLKRAERWFEHYGEITILVSRMLPVVRTFIALPAGVARMRQARFQIYTFVGSLPWCWLLAYAGYRLGAQWESLAPYFHRFDMAWGPLLVAGVVGFAALHVHRARAGSAGRASQ